MPSWYALIRASKYLGVAPWELAEKPAVWMHWAVEAENAETIAKAERQAAAARRQKAMAARKGRR